MLYLEPQLVALIIFNQCISAHGTYFSIEMSTGSQINKGLHHVLKYYWGPPLVGLKSLR